MSDDNKPYYGPWPGVENPQWNKAGRVHDWRNHVGERVQAIWETFTLEQKVALAEDADERASGEHWD